MEPACDDLGGFWSIKTAKDAKIRKFMVEKVCSGKNSRM